jgi:hypothetical protein
MAKMEGRGMRQHIDTIPVWDAYKSGAECPLCELERKNEAAYVENFLGGSVMEPDTRVEVNQKGFCADHFRLLMGAGNKLGVALLAHTHLKETMEAVPGRGKRAPAGPLARLFPGGNRGAARNGAPRCVLCERLNVTMERYVLTLFHLWKSDPEFKRAFDASKGFCLPHYARVTGDAERHLSPALAAQFTADAARIQEENLTRLESELHWFTLKFDYRNADKPWGDSQDAVERTLLKLRGYRTGVEKTRLD